MTEVQCLLEGSPRFVVAAQQDVYVSQPDVYFAELSGVGQYLRKRNETIDDLQLPAPETHEFEQPLLSQQYPREGSTTVSVVGQLHQARFGVLENTERLLKLAELPSTRGRLQAVIDCLVPMLGASEVSGKQVILLVYSICVDLLDCLSHASV